MTDTTPSMQSPVPPPEKETVHMPAAPEWGIYLSDQMRKGFERLDKRADVHDERLDHIERQVAIAVDTGKEHNKRITTLEVKQEQADKRADTNSVRVKNESDVNLKQESVMSQVLTRLTAIEQRPDTTDRVIAEVKAAAKTPLGQKLIGAAGGLLLIVIGFATVAMQVKMTELEKKPEAPTVYVQMPAPVPAVTDGGAP